MKDLTTRESLGLDLESVADKLRDIADKYAPEVAEHGRWEAPTRAELDQVTEAIRTLDRLGLELAPDLYRPKPVRTGKG